MKTQDQVKIIPFFSINKILFVNIVGKHEAEVAL